MRNSNVLFSSPNPKSVSKIHFKPTTITLGGSNILISAINKSNQAHSLYRRNNSKGSRIRLLQEHLSGRIQFFIDDDNGNISSVSEIAKEIETLHYTKEIIQAEVDSICSHARTTRDILALDFDKTITQTHTFQSTRIELNQTTSSESLIKLHQNNFNPSILTLMQQWPGDILIFTDHNNIEFIQAFIKHLAQINNPSKISQPQTMRPLQL